MGVITITVTIVNLQVGEHHHKPETNLANYSFRRERWRLNWLNYETWQIVLRKTMEVKSTLGGD